MVNSIRLTVLESRLNPFQRDVRVLQEVDKIHRQNPLDAVLTDNSVDLRAVREYCLKNKINMNENSVKNGQDSALDLFTYATTSAVAENLVYVCLPENSPSKDILAPKGFHISYSEILD